MDTQQIRPEPSASWEQTAPPPDPMESLTLVPDGDAVADEHFEPL